MHMKRNNDSNVDINVKDDEQENISERISDDIVGIKDEKMIINQDSLSCDQSSDTQELYKKNLIKTGECISKENASYVDNDEIIKDEIECTSNEIINNSEMKDDIQIEDEKLIFNTSSALSDDESDRAEKTVFKATLTGKGEDGMDFVINIEEDISGNCLSVEEILDIREQLNVEPMEEVQNNPPKKQRKRLSAVFLDMIWDMKDNSEDRIQCNKCNVVMRKSIIDFHQKTDSCKINAFLLYIKKTKNLKNRIPCKFCNKQFLGDRMLQHIESKKCNKSLLSVKNIFQNKIRTKLKKMYTCTYCSVEVSSAILLYAHLKKEHCNFSRLLPCNLCNFATYNLRPLYVHMFVDHHDDSGRYKCSYCDFTEITGAKMIEHMNEKHPDVQTNSDQAIATKSDMELSGDHNETSEIEKKTAHKSSETILPEINNESISKSSQSNTKKTLESEETFLTDESLLEHIESPNKQKISPTNVRALLAEAQMISFDHTEPSQSEVKCDKCDKSFLTARPMPFNNCEACLESLDCTKRNWYSCTFCSVTVPYALGLHFHVKQNHPDFKMELLCKDCNFRTSKLRLLYTHMNVKHGSSEGRLKCPHCDYVEFCSTLMNKHKREKHSHLWLSKCAKCLHVFHGKATFQKHLTRCGKRVVMQEKPEQTEEIFLCDICGKIIKKTTFKSHRRAHVTIKEFKCKHCPSKFRASYELEDHSLMHDENGNYKCIECDEVFKTKRSFEMHIHVVHKNRKLYCCNKCDMKYVHKHRYETHLKEVHTDHFRFDCKVCGKKFKRFMHVKQHMVVHTKEQPFGCELCEMRYTQAHALRAHIRAKHKKS